MRRLLLAALTVTLVTVGFVPASTAAFTSTSTSAPSGVTASPDWTPPTVSLRDPGTVLRGTVAVTADAADADSRVARVLHQHRPAGASVWIDTCTVTATGSVFTCAFATAAVADGRYELRAVATDAHGNEAASAVRTTTVDNLAPQVAVGDLPAAIRGSATIPVTASDDGTGVVHVRLQRSPADAGSWTDVCTTASVPFTCVLDTTRLANDDLDLRAIATDGAGNTATSEVETVLVDNLAPTVTVSAPSGTLSGTTTISATASDAHSGVGSVTIQRRPQGASEWTTICVDASAPYSCRFDTTQVPAGSYEFRAVATDVAGNSAASATLTRGVANTAPSVSVEDPGDLVAGTVTVEASAFSPIGIRDVRIQWTAAGTVSWTTLCTDTTAPYRCEWDTTTLPDGPYDLRAILTDVNGVTTTSAVLVGRHVDNTPLRGLDVQGRNGGVLGRIDTGDVLTLTYSDTLDLASVLSGWNGASRGVTVRLRDGSVVGGGALDDTLDVFTAANLNTPVRLGSVNLRADYLKSGRNVTVPGTLAATTVVRDGREVTEITLRIDATLGNNVLRTGGAGTMVWSPSAGVRGTSGVAASTATVTESGPLDRDF